MYRVLAALGRCEARPDANLPGEPPEARASSNGGGAQLCAAGPSPHGMPFRGRVSGALAADIVTEPIVPRTARSGSLDRAGLGSSWTPRRSMLFAVDR